MKMPFLTAEDLQWSLFVAMGDDLSGVGLIGGPRSALTAHREWQEGVDMIYRLTKSNMLLVVGHANEEEILLLGRALAEQNPFTMEPEFLTDQWKPWQLPWLGQLFYASPLCKSLFARYGVKTYDAPLCEALIEDIEALFEQHGAAWSAAPLIPIRGEPRES